MTLAASLFASLLTPAAAQADLAMTIAAQPSPRPYRGKRPARQSGCLAAGSTASACPRQSIVSSRPMEARCRLPTIYLSLPNSASN